jgi:hypothetical protein
MDNESPDPCLVCSGTGWKAIETEGVRSVVRCDCFEHARLDKLFARAGVPPRYESCSFESFNGLTERLRAAKAVLIKFVEEYPLRLWAVDSRTLWRGNHLAVAVLRNSLSPRSSASSMT